jgi:Resolvase, N terminal domain
LSQIECSLLGTKRGYARSRNWSAAKPGEFNWDSAPRFIAEFSTADQSCTRQARDLTAFAAGAGYEISGVFKETGSGVKLDRAERKRLMALPQRREVLVTELSRWGRSTLDLLHTLKELETWVYRYCHERPGLDLSTPHGRMIATIIAGIAEFERELIKSAFAPASPLQKRAVSALAVSPDRSQNPTVSRPKFSPSSLAGAVIG